MLVGYKTYLTGGLAILGAAVAFLTGSMPMDQALQLGLTALMGMFVRAGVATEVAKVK